MQNLLGATKFSSKCPIAIDTSSTRRTLHRIQFSGPLASTLTSGPQDPLPLLLVFLKLAGKTLRSRALALPTQPKIRLQQPRHHHAFTPRVRIRKYAHLLLTVHNLKIVYRDLNALLLLDPLLHINASPTAKARPQVPGVHLHHAAPLQLRLNSGYHLQAGYHVVGLKCAE